MDYDGTQKYLILNNFSSKRVRIYIFQYLREDPSHEIDFFNKLILKKKKKIQYIDQLLGVKRDNNKSIKLT